MGCCAVRTVKISKTTLNSSPLARNLSETRELLLLKIHYLHNLSLLCIKEIESYLLNSNKADALVMKKKWKCIKAKLKDLQEIIARLDQCLDGDRLVSNDCSDIEKTAKKYLDEIKNGLIFDKDAKLGGKDEVYLANLNREMSCYELNDKQVEIEIERQFQLKGMRAKTGPFVRRKYFKAKSAI